MNTSGSLLPIQMNVAEQWPLVIDGAIVISIWVVAITVIVWSGSDALSRNSVPDPTVAGVEP
jgi:hypothetical protein